MVNNVSFWRKERNLTQRELAAKLGCTPGSMSRYEKEDNRLTLPILRKIASALNVSVADLVMPVEAGGRRVVDIPELDVKLSGGSGSASTEESLSRVWAFDRDYVRSVGSEAKNMAIATVHGDSMEPKLNHGERVLIDRCDTDYTAGGIFAVEIGDNLMIKRLQPSPDGKSVIIRSENSAYEDLTKSPDDMRVIGRAMISLHRV